MKIKYLILSLCIFTICLVGCNKGKCSKVNKEDIMKIAENFDILYQYNNQSYHLINSTKGIYLELLEKDKIIYYDNDVKKYYEIDEDTKTKTLLTDNYNLNEYISNVYYILSYHTTKENFKQYNKDKTNYLNQETITYSKKVGQSYEEFIVSNESNLCLSFTLSVNDKKINAKVNSLSLENKDISYLDKYQLIEINENTIKNVLKYFNITVDFNGIEYQFISSSDGYYYTNPKNDISIFYDLNNDKYYSIDKDDKAKILINDKYDIELHSDEIFYLLTYHLDKTLLTNYECSETTFLDQKVVKYNMSINSLNEEIYILPDLNICVYFSIKTDNKNIVSQIKEIDLVDTDLSYLNEYQTLELCDDIELIDQETIINNFNNCDLTINKDGQIIILKKNEYGIFCSIEKDGVTTAILYDKDNDCWYDINENNQEKNKSISIKDDAFITDILLLLTIHLDNIDQKYYKESNLEYLNRKVTKYIRTIITGSTVYKQEYVVDDETGACLEQIINLGGKISSYSITSMSLDVDISNYFNYDEVYYSWPDNVDLVKDLNEIEYGTLVKAMYDKDGFNIIYKDINDSYFRYILKDIENAGFTKNSSIDLNENNGNINYCLYTAINDKDVIIDITYTSSDGTLLIILNNVK